MAQKYDMISNIKYIPLRLSLEERRQFHLLVAALHVSEYVDKVDVVKYQRQDLIAAELRDLYHIIWGLHIASGSRDMKVDEASEEMQAEDNQPVSLAQNADYFASLFEIGRRYKIMNPDKMRSDYGKLLYLMQDACSPEAARALGFRPYKTIVTVQSVLEELQLQAVVQDPRLAQATRPTAGDVPGAELETFKREKEELIKQLCHHYVPDPKDPKHEALERCIRSIDDANCYVRDNVCTIDQAIQYLRSYWSESEPDHRSASLAIQTGVGGSCLSHPHSTQYTFVLQSLTLWKNVQLRMFKLWHTVEADMLDSTRRYKYQYTGQGYNRVQAGPLVHQEMSKILRDTIKEVGKSWVGLSVVHLGDNDVPNALNFIDKYTQIPRIINPIIKCIKGVDEIMTWPGITQWVDSDFGSAEKLKCSILRDFYRHGFDGSGDDGGSCIDGRLTSAWNWCQQLSKKKYFVIFALTGFSSFDGQF